VTISPAAAISPGGLLAEHFVGPSWDRWRAILRAANAEPMTEVEQQLFEEVAERAPPAEPVAELWCVVGRDGGKGSVASAIAATAAVGDYSAHLRSGETAVVLCLAVDRQQARIVSNYTKAMFRENPNLAPLIVRETDDGMELANRCEIIIATNSFRSIRGRTVVTAVLDECAFWRDEHSANPDEEVYTALMPALARIPGSRLIGISSAYRKSASCIAAGKRATARTNLTSWLCGALASSSIRKFRGVRSTVH
jgi:hypothetical protein